MRSLGEPAVPTGQTGGQSQVNRRSPWAARHCCVAHALAMPGSVAKVKSRVVVALGSGFANGARSSTSEPTSSALFPFGSTSSSDSCSVLLANCARAPALAGVCSAGAQAGARRHAIRGCSPFEVPPQRCGQRRPAHLVQRHWHRERVGELVGERRASGAALFHFERVHCACHARALRASRVSEAQPPRRGSRTLVPRCHFSARRRTGRKEDQGDSVCTSRMNKKETGSPRPMPNSARLRKDGAMRRERVTEPAKGAMVT